MMLARFDLQEQERALWELVAALLQPVLWMLLLVGFVLASAHLLTMLGTRWGDRRVSPKALFFSIAVHLSLGVAVIAMIPEYRRHVLSLGEVAPPPIEVELLTPDQTPVELASAGRTAAWDRIPAAMSLQPTRQDIPPADLPDAQPDERRSPIQLADVRPFEPTHVPQLPQDVPQTLARPVESLPQPAPATIADTLPTAEARPEAAPTPRGMQRSTAPNMLEPSEEASTAQLPETLASRTPLPRSESTLNTLSSPLRSETPGLPEGIRLPSAAPTPAPEPLPRVEPNRVASPTDAAPGRASDPNTNPSRSRSQTRSDTRNEIVEPPQPGLLTMRSEPRREVRRPDPPLTRDDPDLPGLYRPDIDPAEALASIAREQVPASYRVRTEQEKKDEAIRKYGGNDDSQRAVERSLAWLAGLQEPDGRWAPAKFDAGNGPVETDKTAQGREKAGQKSDTGITGLVVLAMLGNGNSLSDGPYSASVERAVDWIISQQAANGAIFGDATVFEAMYCHGMATLALAEAYGMESDPVIRTRIRPALERALAYSASAQLDDGGWRYLSGQLGGGDMSMFGWQLMAFRSAKDAGIPTPVDVQSGMIRFLKDRGIGQSGGLAAYRLEDRASPAMTAEALACKQMVGLRRDNPMATEAVSYLLSNRPRLAQINLYYWYYGTIAMFQHGGPEWEQWNGSLRDMLVAEQVTDGIHAGSWPPKGPWARYGGRLYSTALSTLCLEVYYRRLPMYQRGNPEPISRE
ncbi:MAG: hypothetical protein R3B90_03860 [Planctomycetaceae bacterium]